MIQSYILQRIQENQTTYLKMNLEIPSMSCVTISSMSWVTSRKEATAFESKNFVNGWLLKAQATSINCRLSVIER